MNAQTAARTFTKSANRAAPKRTPGQPHKRAEAGVSTVQWYTPPSIVKACGGAEGFDLDPCTPEHGKLPCKTARKHIKPSQDGLATPWDANDFVWLNPPYGRGMDKWMEKLANHPGGGVALVPANTDPRWAHQFVLGHPNTTAVVFLKGRIRFHGEDGQVGGPASFGSMLVAYGKRAAKNVQGALDQGVVEGRLLPVSRNQTFARRPAANNT